MEKKIESYFIEDNKIIDNKINDILSFKLVYNDIMYSQDSNGGYYVTLYYNINDNLESKKMFFENIVETYYFLRGIEKTLQLIEIKEKNNFKRKEVK